MNASVLKLKKYIVSNNKTQMQICREMLCNPTSLNRWMSGNVEPSFAWVQIIENYLKRQKENEDQN